MSAEPPRHETYTHGHAPAVVRHHAKRTAEEAAAFLLPELQPGMRLLDVGCGPGSITRGLAEIVAPGQVIGLDMSSETLDAARRDAAFDAAYAHQVFQHLREREVALREMLRVLRPGGLIAVRDVDWGTVAYWPRDPWIDRFIEVHERTWHQNGGEPQMGRQLRALFNGAGIADVRITASVWCYATRGETTEWGQSYADRLVSSPMGDRPVEYGYASREDIQAMASALRAWGSHPDALWAFIHTAALGRKAG